MPPGQLNGARGRRNEGEPQRPTPILGDKPPAPKAAPTLAQKRQGVGGGVTPGAIASSSKFVRANRLDLLSHRRAWRVDAGEVGLFRL